MFWFDNFVYSVSYKHVITKEVSVNLSRLFERRYKRANCNITRTFEDFQRGMKYKIHGPILLEERNSNDDLKSRPANFF